MPSLLYISIRRLASSVETCSTLSYDTEMNTVVIVSESGIHIEQMYYSFYLTRQVTCRMDPSPCVCTFSSGLPTTKLRRPLQSGVSY